MTLFNPTSEPLTQAELDFLNQTLLKYGNDDSVLDASELDGFLTAIVSGPNMIPPSQWFPALWGGPGSEPDWEDEEEIQRFMSLVMQHMNGIADTLLSSPDTFQALFNWLEVEGRTNRITDEWCEGYMRGVNLDEDSWATAPERLLKENLAIINMFAGEFDDELEELSPSSLKGLQDRIEPAARTLHAYWLQQRSEQAPTTVTQRRNTPKIGRNEACPCGSGKKFKHCCLQ